MNAVLMLCHNALELTKRSVESVLNQDIPVRLLCVDNDSGDGTKEWLAEKGIHMARFSPQIGVSLGWNYGLRFFFESGCDHVLVVNNDTILRKDTYRELLADGGGFVTAVGVNNPEDILGPFVKAVRPHPDFSCYLIRKEVWEKVGPFDTQFFPAYYEDNDYHVRLHQAGIEAYTIGLPFYHIASGTLKNSSSEDRVAIEEASRKNREKFFAKWKCYPGTPEYAALFLSPPSVPACGTNDKATSD